MYEYIIYVYVYIRETRRRIGAGRPRGWATVWSSWQPATPEHPQSSRVLYFSPSLHHSLLRFIPLFCIYETSPPCGTRAWFERVAQGGADHVRLALERMSHDVGTRQGGEFLRRVAHQDGRLRHHHVNNTLSSNLCAQSSFTLCAPLYFLSLFHITLYYIPQCLYIYIHIWVYYRDICWYI